MWGNALLDQLIALPDVLNAQTAVRPNLAAARAAAIAGGILLATVGTTDQGTARR